MPTNPPDTQPIPPLWPSMLACGAVAAWVDLGTIQRLQHADSLLYPMISRWGWTPFYWGQDRLGMLVPLLARPIAHPLANLLFQDFLGIFSGLLSFVLLARYTLRDASYPVVGLMTAASTLALAPPAYQAMYHLDAGYGIWLAMGLGGLILAERPTAARLGLACLLILLAHWVNFTTSLVLGPLVVARALWPGRAVDRRRRLVEAGGSLGMLGVGVAVGGWLTTLPTVKVATTLGALPSSRWPEAWLGLWSRHLDALGSAGLPSCVAGATLVGVVGLAIPAARRRARPAWSAALGLGAAAAVVWLYSGTRVWVRLNGYTYRYMIPSSMMVQVAASGICLGPACLWMGPRVRRRLGLLASAALLGAAAWTFGSPSVGRVRADFDRQFGALTPDLLEGRCTHLAGSYERVWPSVFHAWIALHERGERRVIWGIAGRAEATIERWRPRPDSPIRVGVTRGDHAAALDAFREFGLPRLERVEGRATLDVYLRAVDRR